MAGRTCFKNPAFSNTRPLPANHPEQQKPKDMIYVLWTLLNAFLSAGLLYFLFRIARLIYLRFGLTASILGIFLLCCIGFKRTDEIATSTDRTWEFKASEGVQYFQNSYRIKIYNNPIFSLNLLLNTRSDKDRNTEQPVLALALLEGMSGTNEWTPTNIKVVPTGQTFKYTVTGIVNWNLMGKHVFREVKTFEGEINRH